MRTIHKYTIPFTDDFTIQLPDGAQPLRAMVQVGQPHLWAIVDPDRKKYPRHFRLIGTGHPIAEEDFSYLDFVDTIMLEGGALVFHLFEVRDAGRLAIASSEKRSAP